MKLRSKTPAHVHLNSHSRRMFLKSASGALLAMPLLPSLLTLGSEKALAATTKPLRYVNIFSVIGGLQHRSWLGTNLPQTAHQLYSGHQARVDPITNLLVNNALSPVLNSRFSSLWGHSNLIAGVDQAYYFGHNKSVATGIFARTYPGHTMPQDQLDLSDPSYLTIEYPSLDQVIGLAGGNGIYKDGLGGRRRFLNLATDWTTSSFGRDDYSDLTKPVLPRDLIGTSAGAFNYLFGSGSQQPVNGKNPILHLINEFWPSGRSLLAKLSAADRDSVDQLFQLASQAAQDYSVTPPDLSGIVAPTGTAENWDQPSSLTAMADIIALAFKCDITRVVSIHVGNSIKGYDWHGLSHLVGGPDRNAGQPELVEIHQNISENFVARLGNQLLAQDPFDPQNSMLHNSYIQWVHEHKIAHHNFSNPTFTMGAAGGRLNTGVFADLRNFSRQTTADDGSGDPIFVGDVINRLWATALYGMNISRSNYEMERGGSSNQSAVISKGYGHHLKNPGNAWNSTPDYDISRIGEPWEFLKKTGTDWD